MISLTELPAVGIGSETARPREESRGRVHLTVRGTHSPGTSDPVEAGQPLARHALDGWRLARPYPMRRGTLLALRACVRHIAPGGAAPHGEELLMRVETQVRTMMAYMPRLIALALCVAFRVINWAPRWLFVSGHRLGHLDETTASRVLGRMTHSRFFPLRLCMQGTRAAVLCCYFDQPEVHAAIGYTPVPFITERMALREQLLAAGRSPTARDEARPDPVEGSIDDSLLR